ncbi:M61 family metallopeptidase [Undibacterium fentianense]|uniref:M61 family metallopeptidase n=1 Tax=Undibacterium fentianense TaxID=2828728 RepID=A0A941E4P1_9BURK|nr:PDZ domain-containing protein [Undibacterium fentianense]MBR7799693.1 M61 family metallopeptidase [Undibacterium fentianense]
MVAQTKHALFYQIKALNLSAHLFEIELTVANPDLNGQIVSLPVWIPGSYMVREFARNIVQISAFAKGKKLGLKKLNKSSWQASPCDSPLQIVYQVYAWDLSVRAAHLDQTHGFFNGTSVFLQVHGQEQISHVVDIQQPLDPAAKNWRVATSLPELKAKRYGFGTYVASDYDELVDHPVEMGDFALVTFKAHGVPHDVVVTGRVPNLDLSRLAKDLQKICEAEIAFFEPRTKQAPMERYVFLTMAVGEGYGGLEHRASTALICSRNDLPTKNDANMSEAYRSFLGLCSHEYFHTWNVKRIKPASFASYDLAQENYTSLLWLFEGFTSYYDDLFLRRCEIIDEAAYLKLVAKTINSVQRGSGRKKQSLADSSFDAWTKYYRQDENAPNAIVSYYAKGSLVALGLDLMIRAETAGKKSLDDVMRALWKKYGKDFYLKQKSGMQQGLSEDGFAELVEQVTGVSVARFIDRIVKGTEDLPLAKLYADFGVSMVEDSTAKKPSMNARLGKSGADCKLLQVFDSGAAQKAGMSAGDILVAINGLRVSASDVANNLSTLFNPYRVGETVEVHAFRRDELHRFQLKLQPEDAPSLSLQIDLTKDQAGSKKRQAPLDKASTLKRPSQR